MTAYQPLGDILREHFGILDSDGPERVRLLLRGRELLALALGHNVACDLHPLTVRERFHSLWRAFLEEFVAERPVVLLIEDLHWAEQPLLDLLEVVPAEVNGPLLVIKTARPDAAPLAGGEAFRLEPLTGDEPSRLLTELFGSDPHLS